MNLVIVESFTKGKTIKKFLGPQYRILSSSGHIRNLPKSEFGIDVEHNFEPKYIVIPKARKIITYLKKETAKANLILLSTDPDREGEAIAYHLVELLKLNGQKPYQRIVFHEITKSAIEEALKNPRKIDLNLVEAQQARRILDRIVGYKLSPFLWKKVARGLSAGRVQSVAVRLVCEREREIENFVAQEYWTIVAQLKKMVEKSSLPFEALLIKADGKTIPKLGIKTKKEAENILENLDGAEYKVINIEKKEIKRNPLPPFTTSTLQQESWKRFRWPAKMTMFLSQQLYENGYITYHRTDSLNLSDLSLFAAKKWICQNYGLEYWPGFLRKFKTKSKLAQEAHEAIRPTYAEKTPESLKANLNKNQFQLYDLIWRRFIACQMAQSRFDSTKVEIGAKIKSQISKIKTYGFQANGSILKFDGFLKVYPIKYEEIELPPLEINEILELIKLIPQQHFTQPPPRYNEATLIKELEKNGIGRPSTYAPILSTIQERNYVEKDKERRFRPTEIGLVVNDLLVNHFRKIVELGFTAKMEENLDKIAGGEKKWLPVIDEFYQPFEENLQKKYQEISKEKIALQKTEKVCFKCGAALLIRLGKFGKFYACSKFPECRYTESLKENTLGIKCPKCKEGEIVEKRTKKKKIFYGCSNWPNCDFALWDKPIGKICPKCGSLLVETKKRQIGSLKSTRAGAEQFKKAKCSKKECDYLEK